MLASPFHLVGAHPSPWSGMFTDITFHPVPLAVIVTATVAYLRAARRTSWPQWRTAAFLGAIVTVGVATLSGLDAFERNSFIVVAVQHSLLALLAPVLLALSSPVSLSIEASHPATAARIRAVVTGRAGRMVAFPLIPAICFMSWFFLLYFTPLYRTSLDHPALWDFDALALVVLGSLFVWPLVAQDALPRTLGHGFRMVWFLLSLPFFTILGMSLESQTKTIAPGLSLAELHAGGGVIWVSGEILGLLGVIAVLVQWCRLEETAATRRDRNLDPEAAVQLAHWKANRRSAAVQAGLLPPAGALAPEAGALALDAGALAPDPSTEG